MLRKVIWQDKVPTTTGHDLSRSRLVLPAIKRLTTIAKEWPQMKSEQQKSRLEFCTFFNDATFFNTEI